MGPQLVASTLSAGYQTLPPPELLHHLKGRCPSNPDDADDVTAAGGGGGALPDPLSFSVGPRDCVGQNLARLELQVVVAAMVAGFNWRAPRECAGGGDEKGAEGGAAAAAGEQESRPYRRHLQDGMEQGGRSSSKDQSLQTEVKDAPRASLSYSSGSSRRMTRCSAALLALYNLAKYHMTLQPKMVNFG